MPRLPRLRSLLLASSLLVSSGCALTGKADTHSEVPDEVSADENAAAEPAQANSNASSRHLLLGTGAIQLGPGLGKNAYRWLGDGQWGF